MRIWLARRGRRPTNSWSRPAGRSLSISGFGKRHYQASSLGAPGIVVNVLASGAIETDLGGGVERGNAELDAFVAANKTLGGAGMPDDF
jgi:hypothetical protein